MKREKKRGREEGRKGGREEEREREKEKERERVRMRMKICCGLLRLVRVHLPCSQYALWQIVILSEFLDYKQQEVTLVK
jgi:hypothetical protein